MSVTSHIEGRPRSGYGLKIFDCADREAAASPISWIRHCVLLLSDVASLIKFCQRNIRTVIGSLVWVNFERGLIVDEYRHYVGAMIIRSVIKATCFCTKHAGGRSNTV